MIKQPYHRIAAYVTCTAVALSLSTAMMANLAQADELASSGWPSMDSLTRLADAPDANAPSTSMAAQSVAAPAVQTQKAAASNGLTFASASNDDTTDVPTSLQLKQNVMVDASVIRLGDLFDQPITGGDTPIAQAPKPGQTMSLDARFLRQLARAYRLELDGSQNFDHILVARKAQLIKSDTVTAAIISAISQRTQQSDNMDIAFDTGEVQFTLPTNVPATVAVQGLNFDPSSNRFLAILAVPATGPTLYTQQVVGTVYEKTQVPVLKRMVSAGDTIQPDDIDWISTRTDQLAPNAVTDADQMVGRTAKRPLRANQTVRSSDLINEPAIHKNTLITIAVQTADMSLTVRGKALEDGAVGQTVRVVNVNTNKQLVGVVKDGTTVLIQPTGPLAMN